MYEFCHLRTSINFVDESYGYSQQDLHWELGFSQRVLFSLQDDMNIIIEFSQSRSLRIILNEFHFIQMQRRQIAVCFHFFHVEYPTFFFWSYEVQAGYFTRRMLNNFLIMYTPTEINWLHSFILSNRFILYPVSKDMRISFLEARYLMEVLYISSYIS